MPDAVTTPAIKFDPKKIRQLAEYKHDRPLTVCRIDPSGKFVFAGAQDFHIHRWDLKSGKKTQFTGHESWVRSFDFSPDGDWLLSAGWDGKVVWWPTADATPKPHRMLEAHRGFTRWVRVSPNGKLVATCGNDNLVRVWDMANAKQIWQFAGHQRHVYAVDFHPDGKHLVSGDLMGVLKVWDLESGKEVRTIDAGVMQGYDKKFAATMGGARDMRFNKDGSVLACAGITNVRNAFAGVQTAIVLLLDWKTGKQIQKLGDTNGDYQGIAWGVRFHPAGFIIGTAASRSSSGVLWFWNADQPKPLHTVKLKGGGRGLDLTPDAQTLAIAQSDGALRLYQAS